MGFAEELRGALEDLVGPGRVCASRKQLADYLEMDPSQLNRFLDGKRGITTETVDKILDRLGGHVAIPGSRPEENARTVCFVSPETANSPRTVGGPRPEDFLAVPMAAAPVAAGKGIIPEDAIRSWVLIWRHEEAVRFKTDLVAVQVGRSEYSMVPTLYPGDIVLVDRSDKNPDPPGKIMLVMEPGGEGDPGGAMIKRVSTKRVDGDIELVFYSDNAREYAPYIYRLKRDYGGDISRAVAGHVIWSWANMTKR